MKRIEIPCNGRCWRDVYEDIRQIKTPKRVKPLDKSIILWYNKDEDISELESFFSPEELENQFKRQVSELLSSTDFTQLADVRPSYTSESLKNIEDYRQQLREISYGEELPVRPELVKKSNNWFKRMFE